MADGAGIQRAPSGGIRRAPSDGFRRAGSGASVTFDRAASGGATRVPSITRAASGGSKSSAKATFLRVASSITRTSSKSAAFAQGGSAGWAKLRAVAAITRVPSHPDKDSFSRLPSGFQRVPSANAPGSLGIVVPLSFSKTLTEEQSLRQSRAEIKKWKEDQSTQVHEKIVDLEGRMGRLSVLDDRLNGVKAGEDGFTWSDVLPGAVPDKIETETQKYMLAKQAANTVRRIVVGDLDMPDAPWEESGSEGGEQDVLAAEDEPDDLAEEQSVASKPSTANTLVADEVMNLGWQDGNCSKPAGEAPSGADGAGGMGGGGDGNDDERDAEESLEQEAQRPKSPSEKTGSQIQSLQKCCKVSLPLLCGGFTRNSVVRNICFDVYTSRYTQAVFHFVWFANIIFVAASPEMNRVAVSAKTSVGEWAALAFNFLSVLILSVEVVTGIIALGLQGSPGTWLRISVFHKIDLAVFLVCILEVIGSFYGRVMGFLVPTMRPFRLLRVFKLTYLTKLLKDFNVILLTLDKCSGQLITVFLICLFYFLVFSIFGMALYQKSFRRTCILVDHAVPSCASDFSTSWNNTCSNKDFVRQAWVIEAGDSPFKPSSGFPLDRSCKYWDVADKTMGYRDATYKGKYPVDTEGRYHTCQLDRFRIDGAKAVTTECHDTGNPGNGFMHFDHVGGAFVVVLQISIPDSQYEVLTRALETQPHEKLLTAAYFGILVSAFCTFMELGLFLAVIAKAYGAAAAEQRANVIRVGMIPPRPIASRHERLEWFMQLRIFRFLTYATIILQVAVLAVDGHSMKQSRKLLTDLFGNELALWYLDLACNLFFVVEASLKFAAVGFSLRKFVQEPANILWSLVLICSIVGFTLAHPEMLPSSLRSDPRMDWVAIQQIGKILKSLVSLRMYMLMAMLPTLYHMLSETIYSLRSILDISVFLLLCNFCTAVCGRYLLGNRMTGRSNFSSLFSAVLTSFQIFTADSWTGILYDAMSAGENHLWSFINATFIVIWLIFSLFVIGNLFVSAIVTHIQVLRTMRNIEKPGYQSFLSNMLRTSHRDFINWKNRTQKQIHSLDAVSRGLNQFRKSMRNLERPQSRSPTSPRLGSDSGDQQDEHQQDEDMFPELRNIPLHKRTARTKMLINIVQDKFDRIDSPGERQRRAVNNNANLHLDFTEPVLCGFTKSFGLRQICIYLDQHPLFDAFIMFIVVASCIFIVLSPQYPDVPGAKAIIPYDVSNALNYAFTICFLVEFVVRVMSRGFLNTRHAYLTSGWNRMDFCILIFALVDISGIIPVASAGKVLRSARILSPLRLIKRNEGLKVLINAFIGTLQPIGYVMLYTSVTYSVFALLGMSLFGGRFYSCNTPGAEYPGGKALCSGSHVLEAGDASYVVPRAWSNPAFHFDDFSSSLETIYRIGTLKYVSVMYAAMDVTAVDQSPQTNFSIEYSLFFVIFLILGGLFVVNIVVAFTVDGINVNQGRTEADLRYSEIMSYLRDISKNKSSVKPLDNPASTILRRILDSRYFQIFSAACIAVNAVFMLTDHADASAQYAGMIENQNNIFYGELVAEVLLRFLADGPRYFVSRKWNLFDAIIALGLTFSLIGGVGAAGQVAKGLRMIRLLRLMLFIRPIRIVFDTLLVSLPQLINVSGLLVLVMYSSAALGVALYSETRFQAKLGPAANFRTFLEAMKVIYQILVGEEWQDLMADCSVQPPFCTPQFDGYTFGDCGYSTFTPFFFIFIKTMCELMILNLLVGLILDNLSMIMSSVDHHDTANWSNGASRNQIQQCAAVFERYDAGTGKIPLTCIHAIMQHLPQPLGFRAKPVLGLRWLEIGKDKPTDGRNLKNVELAEAMLHKTEFTQQEWDKFGINDLQAGDFVKSGDSYFMPDDQVQGSLVYGSKEKVFERLIRSELNLVAIENQSQAKLLAGRSRRQLSLWKFFKVVIFGKKKPDRFSSGVSFQQTMLTMMAWRTPHLLSIEAKRDRRKIIADVVYMSHALQVFDFFKFVISKQVHKKITKDGKSRGQFIMWARSCEHYSRRMGLKTDWTIFFRRPEDNAGGPLGTVEPLEIVPVHMRKIEKLPKGTLLHREAKYWDATQIFPSDGIELLMRKLPENTIFCKFVDGAHKHNGIVAIDFPEDCFDGWETHSLRKDTFLEPPVRQLLASKPSPWSRLDFVIRVSEDMELPDAPVGTLMDVQGFVAQDETPDYPPMTVAPVRLNLSKALQHVSHTNRNQATSSRKAKQKMTDEDMSSGLEIVLEVVGYLKRRKLHHASQGAMHGSIGKHNSGD